MKEKFLISLTGASGMIYALSFLKLLKKRGIFFDLIFSETAQKVLKHELNLQVSDLEILAQEVYEAKDMAAPPASGSVSYKAMVIIPCTMGTLSAVAQGASRNLIHRAADVTLKERRPLVLVVRETPFNMVHLRNMLKAAEAGAIIYPAMPAFYHHPQTLEDLIEFFIMRLACFLGIEIKGMKKWGEI